MVPGAMVAPGMITVPGVIVSIGTPPETQPASEPQSAPQGAAASPWRNGRMIRLEVRLKKPQGPNRPEHRDGPD